MAASVASHSLGMSGIVKSFMYHAVLHREEMAVGCIHVFFYRPSERTVVKDEIRAIFSTAGIFGKNIAGDVFLSDAEAHVSHDKVLRASEIHLVAGDYDAFTRRGLSRESPVGAVDTQLA